MEDKQKAIILFFLTFIFTTITTYFFSLTKITINMLLTINFIPLMDALTSLNFLLFLFSSSLLIGTILISGRTLKEPYKEFIPSVGLFLAILLGLFLFNLLEYIIPAVLVVITIPFTVNYLDKREAEVKYLKRFRAGRAAAGRFLIIITTIFVLYLLIIGFASRETLAKEFVPSVISTIVKDNQDTNTQIKTETFNSILEDTFRQMPFIKFFEDNAWLLYPINILILVTFINGVFTQNLSAFFYWIADTLIRKKEEKLKVKKTE